MDNGLLPGLCINNFAMFLFYLFILPLGILTVWILYETISIKWLVNIDIVPRFTNHVPFDIQLFKEKVLYRNQTFK